MQVTKSIVQNKIMGKKKHAHRKQAPQQNKLKKWKETHRHAFVLFAKSTKRILSLAAMSLKKN